MASSAVQANSPHPADVKAFTAGIRQVPARRVCSPRRNRKLPGASGLRLIPRSWTQPVFRLKQVVRRARAASWAGALRQHGVEIIGVTGSHGKSTTTALLGSILSDAASVAVGVTRNHANDAVRTLARARPGLDQFVVQEVGFSEPGSVAESARLLGPTVAIVTAIGGDHRKAVGGSRERMAAEKATLVQALRPGGLVVLNADDPLVAAMADLTSCRVVTFGRSGKATLRLLDASSRCLEDTYIANNRSFGNLAASKTRGCYPLSP